MAKLRASLFEHVGFKRETSLNLSRSLKPGDLVAKLLPELFSPGNPYKNYNADKLTSSIIL